MGLAIDYHCMTAETLADSGASFDVIYASEVIEHVANRQVFIAAIARMLRLGCGGYHHNQPHHALFAVCQDCA